VVHEKLGNFDASVAHMKRTIALSPQHASALNYLGYMYAERGLHLDESIDAIQQALTIEPNNGYFRDSLGWAFFKKGWYDKALKELERAVAVVPDDPVIQEHLGDVYFRLRRLPEARQAWEKSLTLKPENAAVEEKLREIRALIEEAAHGASKRWRP
jgi:tetratricopeptide (TPR) repeat protein